jgi:hypothetical protein
MKIKLICNSERVWLVAKKLMTEKCSQAWPSADAIVEEWMDAAVVLAKDEKLKAKAEAAKAAVKDHPEYAKFAGFVEMWTLESVDDSKWELVFTHEITGFPKRGPLAKAYHDAQRKFIYENFFKALKSELLDATEADFLMMRV